MKTETPEGPASNGTPPVTPEWQGRLAIMLIVVPLAIGGFASYRSILKRIDVTREERRDAVDQILSRLTSAPPAKGPNFYTGCEWTGTRGRRTLNSEAMVITREQAKEWMAFYLDVLDEQQALEGVK